MAAVQARLYARAVTSGRAASRRKLHLQALGAARSGAADVLILDVSRTGLLLETVAELSKGETIELDIPEAPGTRAVVVWTSGRLFGCQFTRPISIAAMSAALLRASYGPRHASPDLASEDVRDPAANAEQSGAAGELSRAARLSWIIGLALLSWAMIAAAVAIMLRYLH